MKGKMVALYCTSDHDVFPWAVAGYECYAFDIVNENVDFQIGEGIVHMRKLDLSAESLPYECKRPDFVAAHPPCTNGAVSGAKHFARKGLAGLKEYVTHLEKADWFLRELQAPGYLEQPVVIDLKSYWRKPDHYFHPYQYSALGGYEDHITKKTSVWGYHGFVMPEEKTNLALGKPRDDIHKMSPGKDRAAKRSLTPLGWSIAVFEANNRLGLKHFSEGDIFQ